ncbi:hypothetical protein JW758_03370 [Candidatus Peregrinibacteria bacterium]|nr:hypothetical protein [Candidatus Peregrinibacteria bacterium]
MGWLDKAKACADDPEKCAKDALEAGEDTLNKGKEIGKKKLEEVKQINAIKGDIKELSDTQDYFRRNKESLEGLGMVEAVSNPKKVKEEFKKANGQIEKGKQAIEAIKKSKIRFSEAFIGETIKDIDTMLESLEGSMADIINDITNPDTIKGKIAEWTMDESTLKELSELSVEIRSVSANAKTFRKNLNGIVDKKLKEPSNNDTLNGIIKANKLIGKGTDKFLGIYDAIKLTDSILR